jgi:small-conductance mechanosensitive channel
MDYTLFIFDNNNVQVSDIFDFLKVAIIALIAQWLIIWFLHNKMNYGSSHLSVFIIKIVVLCYLIYDFATQVLNLNPTNLTIFASAFSLAFGFGMQSIIQNFVAGLIMIGEKTVKTGDSITLADGRSGIVTNVNYRTTTLKTDDNCLIMVPNSKVFLETIENKTKLDPKVRVKIVFLVDKDADFEQMEVILKNACNDIAGFIDEPAPELTISSITKDGVNVEFRLHVKNSDYADTQVITRKLYARLLEESVKR